MVLHLLRMCKNVNQNVYNDRKNVSGGNGSLLVCETAKGGLKCLTNHCPNIRTYHLEDTRP